MIRVALAVACLASAAPAQDLEAWARDLVDHEAMVSGDTEELLDVWLSRVESQPGHPLVEATLRIVEQVGVIRDPAALGARLRGLDADALRPPARHVLERLVARDQVRRDPVATLGDDLYPSVLGIYAVAGPLPPLGRPLALEDPDARLLDPVFAEPLEGLDGPVRWQAVARDPLRPALALDEAFDPSRGFALVAARFVVAEGGPAWIELDSGDVALGPVGPSVVFSVNGEAPVFVDRWRTSRPPVHREPVVLRTGHNVVVAKVALGRSPRLAVRVMTPDGAPYPDVAQNFDLMHGGLSERVDAHPPRGPFPDARTLLEQLGDERGPDASALLGVLRFLDGDQLEAVDVIEQAYERSGRAAHAALLASFVDEARQLPSAWRRNRALQLAERVAEVHPYHVPTGIYRASVMVSEDREVAAIRLLKEMTAANPEQVRSLLMLEQVYAGLGMTAESEAAVDAAWLRAPEHPTVMRRRADRLAQAGLGSDALEFVEHAVRREGATAGKLAALAQQWAQRGAVDRAGALVVEALGRGGGRDEELTLARLLLRRDDDEDGRAILDALCRRHPRWRAPHWERALVAYHDGDLDAERRRLEEVLVVDPSHVPARRRLAVLTGVDPVERTFERFEVDGAEVLAEYGTGADQDASVVRVLDHQVVHVASDGSVEIQTHEIVQPRDLNGCETEGTVVLRGEVLDVATVKPDGTRYEPVRVNGEYVMPLLEPGDFIETIVRDRAPPPSDGDLRLGRWYFASIQEPFWISRYVVSVPKDLGLHVELDNFDGTHEVIDEGDRLVHVVERSRSERILPEPGMPPRDWFAPWVEMGVPDDDPAEVLDTLREPLLPLARTTPQVRAVVDEVRGSLGDVGEQALARALHRRAVESVDQVEPGLTSSATQALLSRAGNPTVVYAALLAAAGVEHEFVWSRGVVPEGDPEPDPTFLQAGWIGRRLYLVVRPDDGPEAWCDPTQRALPYGRILHDAPGAVAFGTGATGLTNTPAVPLVDRPGFVVEADVHLSLDGSAEATGRGTMTGNLGFPLEEQARDIPTAARRVVIAQAASAVMPGIDVTGFEVGGLGPEARDEPLSVDVTGRVPGYLDDDGAGLVCAFPMRPLELSAVFGGEGARRLPLLLTAAQVDRITVRLHVPPGLELLDAPTSTLVDFPRGRYELSVSSQPTPDGGAVWTFRRQLALGECAVAAEDYAAFAARCAEVDAAERTRLRFARR